MMRAGCWSDDWLKDNPAVPGGSLKNKPTWGNISKCSPTSASFFGLLAMRQERQHNESREIGEFATDYGWAFCSETSQTSFLKE